MLRELATVAFFADDLTAAKEWYSELLGIDAYYQFPPQGTPAYVEFRIGDYNDELGFIDRRYAPHDAATSPAGAVIYWHVDDLTATFEKLLSMGAKEHEKPTERAREPGSSPHRSSTRSATCWASCPTRTTSRCSPRCGRPRSVERT